MINRVLIVIILISITSCGLTKPRTAWAVGNENGKLKWGDFCEVTGTIRVKEFEVDESGIYSIQGVTFHNSIYFMQKGDSLDFDNLIIQCGTEGTPIYLYTYKFGKFKLLRKLSESKENGVCNFQVSNNKKTYIVFGEPNDWTSGSYAIKTSYFIELLDKRYSMKGMTMECEKENKTGNNKK